MNPATVFDLLLDIRRTALKTRPGTAIILERPRRLDETVLLPSVDVLDQDNICLLENNDIAGILSLYGLPAPIALVDQLLNGDILQLLSSRLKENQIRFTSSFLAPCSCAATNSSAWRWREVVEELRKAAEAQQSITFAFDVFGRCQWGDNVFEGGRNLLVCRHLTMHANEFTQSAQPQGAPVIGPANLPAVAGTLIADSTIYVANHGSGNVTLRNLSRLMDQVANQEITIS